MTFSRFNACPSDIDPSLVLKCEPVQISFITSLRQNKILIPSVLSDENKACGHLPLPDLVLLESSFSVLGDIFARLNPATFKIIRSKHHPLVVQCFTLNDGLLLHMITVNTHAYEVHVII